MLESLYEKLKFHFHAEESIMQIFAYPEALEHKKSHLEILRSVEGHKNSQLSDTEIKRLRDQPLQLFMEQILSQDMRFLRRLSREARTGLAFNKTLTEILTTTMPLQSFKGSIPEDRYYCRSHDMWVMVRC